MIPGTALNQGLLKERSAYQSLDIASQKVHIDKEVNVCLHCQPCITPYIHLSSPVATLDSSRYILELGTVETSQPLQSRGEKETSATEQDALLYFSMLRGLSIEADLGMLMTKHWSHNTETNRGKPIPDRTEPQHP